MAGAEYPTFSRGSTLADVVETIAVFPVKAAPDAPLQRIEAALEDADFRVGEAEAFDLAARRGLDRLFLGLAAHPEGLAARWKTKSLVPGRGRETHRIVRRILGEVLGEPLRLIDPGGEGR